VIVANLMASRLTVLYGPSGVGKTSLLRAGVAHRLRREQNAIVVVFSSWTGDPIANLLDTVEAAAGDGANRRGALADVLAASTRRLDSELYIVLDQFEEYFLYNEDESGPGTLAEELPEAVRRAGLRVNFLIGIREDSLASLDAFKARIPNLFGNSLRLDLLERSTARAAILGPLQRYNELVPTGGRVEAEPELVEGVLDEVSAGRVDQDIGDEGRRDAIEATFAQDVRLAHELRKASDGGAEDDPHPVRAEAVHAGIRQRLLPGAQGEQDVRIEPLHILGRGEALGIEILDLARDRDGILARVEGAQRSDGGFCMGLSVALVGMGVIEWLWVSVPQRIPLS